MNDPQSVPESDWFWTASGKAVGFREQNVLFCCEGSQIGEFRGDEVYGATGSYLGEISPTGRLVSNSRKLNWKRAGFRPQHGKTLELPQDLGSLHLTSGYGNFKVPAKNRETEVATSFSYSACQE